MKLFIVISVVCGIFAVSMAMSPEQRKELENRLISECAGKEGVTDADLAEMKSRKLPTTRTGKCLHACVIETLGFVRDNVLHLETIVDMAKMVLKDEKKVNVAREIATECGAVTDTDRCELAYKMLECAVKAAEKRGINFSEYL